MKAYKIKYKEKVKGKWVKKEKSIVAESEFFARQKLDRHDDLIISITYLGTVV